MRRVYQTKITSLEFPNFSFPNLNLQASITSLLDFLRKQLGPCALLRILQDLVCVDVGFLLPLPDTHLLIKDPNLSSLKVVQMAPSYLLGDPEYSDGMQCLNLMELV